MAMTEKDMFCETFMAPYHMGEGPISLTASYKEREKISYSVGPHSFSVPFGSIANKVKSIYYFSVQLYFDNLSY